MPNAFHSPSSVSYHPRGGKEFIKTAKCTTAVSLKSCTSCTDLDFTRLATTISRKINYDVTQSRPEGAARLHTPQDKKKKKKKCSTLSSSTTQNKKKKQKNGATVRKEREKGGRKGREGGEWGLFSVSVTSMTQIFHRLSKSPHCSRSSTGSFACLKFNGGRADMHMRTLTLGLMKACTHAKMKQTHRQQLHEPNKFCGRSTNTNIEVRDEDLPLPKSQNPAEV